MKYRNLIAFLLLFSFSRCDMANTRNTTLVGDLTLINPKTQSDDGYSLVLVDGAGINENVLKEYVENACGNDSVLFVHCKSENENGVYYKILHNKGHQPISVLPLSFKLYTQQKDSINIDYRFNDK